MKMRLLVGVMLLLAGIIVCQNRKAQGEPIANHGNVIQPSSFDAAGNYQRTDGENQ